MTAPSNRGRLKAALLHELACRADDAAAAEHLWELADDLGLGEATAEQMIASIADEVGDELRRRVERLGGIPG